MTSTSRIRTANRPLTCLGVIGALLFTAFNGVASGAPSKQKLTETHIGGTTVSNPFAHAELWVDPDGEAARAAASVTSTDPAGAAALVRIAQQPQAVWFGDWIPSTRLTSAVSRQIRLESAAGALPVFVVYDILDRDCGGYSHGGAPTAEAYRTWVAAFAAGLGRARAAVILEPDALSHLTSCHLSPAAQGQRLELLAWAARRLTRQSGTVLYIDAGSSGWNSAAVMASRLRAAGIDYAQGFSLNVSDFKSQKDVLRFGHQLSALLGGRHFVTDTSRNGNGPPALSARSLWCNPAGRALGQRPTVHTGDPLEDAVLWIKHPGQSDGQCDEGDPPSGSWFPTYAIGLASRSRW